jgi:pimeloyl-ACP methyl ester carboxylesterase
VIQRILKCVGIAILSLIVIVPSFGLIYRKYLQYRVARERAIRSPHGIDSLEAVEIGGIRQWIEVRGQNVDNPILLFIHGGPGIAFIPLAGSFDGPWEQHFTVVQWDQRGAGKTYASNDKELQRRTMNVPRMEQDALEVVNYLRSQFHRKKIFVVGPSWGSVLGLWLAHEHPDLLYAYVGTGQVVNMEQNAETMYKEDLEQAESQHNEEAIKELESIAPYPPAIADLGKTLIASKWAGRFLGPPQGRTGFTDVRRILTDVISAPEYSLADDAGFIKGQKFSGEILLPQIMKLDLSKMGTEYRVPIFFFEGRRDPYCLAGLVEEFSQTISAPHKEFVWFEHSGHFPFYEEKQKFADELFQRVLPLAAERPGNN